MVSDKSKRDYYNVLDFCYDMDTLSFRKYLILPYLKKHINGYKHYFQNGFFENFDKQYIEAARQILTNTNIEFTILDLSVKNSDEKLADIFKKYKIGEHNNSNRHRHIAINVHDGKNNSYLYIYDKLDILYKFVTTKMPELFEEIEIIEEYDLDIKMDTMFKLNDNINNPININKDIFSKMVSVFFGQIFDNNKVLYLDKCKQIEKEIELECCYSDNNIFDL